MELITLLANELLLIPKCIVSLRCLLILEMLWNWKLTGKGLIILYMIPSNIIQLSFCFQNSMHYHPI